MLLKKVSGDCLMVAFYRLMILGSYDRETYVHCTLELSSHKWKEKTRSSIKKVCFPLPQLDFLSLCLD